MKAEKTILEGVLVIQPEIFSDSRGFFLESFNRKKYQSLGISNEFVQDNHSRSVRNVLRGLHFQKNNPQGKLVRCTKGKVLDVIVDIEKKSETFGKHVMVELSEENGTQVWIPPGYAHGFLVLSEYADFNYKCTAYYDPNDQRGVIWNDPFLNIQWPVTKPILSEKDSMNPYLTTS